ncbi:MAG TPA: hypothetical protein VKU87_04795, partial [Thermomicrobiaceae bacterium]|nr:hypothetical protein [Thermomicrobiaceae bacterium]
MASNTNSFGAAAEATLSTSTQTVSYYRLDSLAELVPLGLDRLPYTVKILLENTLRHSTSGLVTEGEIKQLAAWRPGKRESGEFPFLPARVLLQDFTGVPAVVDL